jgi:hypothetical protein
MSRIHQLHGEVMVNGGFDRQLATLWLDAFDSKDVYDIPLWESDMSRRCEDPEILAAQLKEHTGVTLSVRFKELMLHDLRTRRGNELTELPDVTKDGEPLARQPRWFTLAELLTDNPTSQED